MKNIILFIFLISGIFGIAQSDETEFERLVEAEMKAAASRQAVVVNPNTLNYDITYHELRYTVDPADYFIAGTVSTTFTALENMNSITFDMANEDETQYHIMLMNWQTKELKQLTDATHKYQQSPVFVEINQQ